MSWPRGLPRERVERVVIVMGDIEMGAGGPLDDFQHSDWLITGSKWQHGFVKVTDFLGKDAAPVTGSFKKALSSKSALIGKAKNGKQIKAAMESAVKKSGG